MRNQIMNVINGVLVEVLPDLEGENINPDQIISDLGADSVDRGEIIALSMERLNYEGSRIEFANARTLNEMADVFEKKAK